MGLAQLFMVLPQVIQLVLQLFGEIHTVQQNAGLSGADKSQAVIDKVGPLATTLGAESDHIQSLINGFVGIFKALGTLKAPAAGNDTQSGSSAG